MSNETVYIIYVGLFIIQLNNFSKQNFGIDKDKHSSNHSWTSSGLRTTQGAMTYIVAKAMLCIPYGRATLRLGVLKRTLSHI